MKRLLGTLFGLMLGCTSALAQTPSVPYYSTNGNPPFSPVTPNFPLPVEFGSASNLGGFTAQAEGTPISATTGGVSGTLPAGKVVVATNVGATNGAYCSLGASADTGGQYLSPGGGWFAFQVGTATQLTCITGTSTTTVNMVGGTGLPTGTGGGGGITLTKSGTYASSGTDQFALAVSTNTQLTVPANTTCAQITVEAANIRRTSDGTSATTTNGTLIPAGSSWQDCGPLAAYKFTAVSGSPTLDVEYMK